MELHCGTVLGKNFDLVSCATLLSEQSHRSFGHKTDPVELATSNWTKPIPAGMAGHCSLFQTSQTAQYL